MHLLLKGIVIGFSIAAPVGPIGALCIRRTLAEGRAVGFASGLGAATADGIYAAIAAFGLTAVSGFLIGEQHWLRLIGGIFLLLLGARTLLARPTSANFVHTAGGLAKAYVSTLGLTLTNPVTVIAFVAVFAGLGVTAGGDHVSAAVLVAGVFLGSTSWWATMSVGVGASRRLFAEGGLRWVNRIAGIVIAAFGAVALVSAMR